MKNFFTVFILFFVSFNLLSQNSCLQSECFFPADDEICAQRTNYLNNLQNYYAVYQYNSGSHCMYLEWTWPIQNCSACMAGVTAFVVPGQGSSTPIQEICCIKYCETAPPYGPGLDNYVAENVVFTNQDYILFYYSENDTGYCTYASTETYYEHFGFYPNYICAGGSSSMEYDTNENNSTINTDLNISSKTTGVYPTIVADKINIIESQEIKNIDIIDINGSIVKKYKTDKYYSGTYNLSDLNSGIYIIRITTIDNIQKNYKIIKE